MNKNFNTIRYKDNLEINLIDQIRINKVLKMIGTNKDVLDLGCLDGFITELIIKNNNKCTGVEISTNAIEQCKQKNIEILDLDLNQDWAKSINKKYDVVFAGELIEHIFDTDKLLQNIKQILKPDGYIVLTTPNVVSFGRRLLMLFEINPLLEFTARPYDAGHIRYFTYKSLAGLLNENRFIIKECTSDVINFDNKGKVYSKLLATIFPRFGKAIIIKAQIK